MSTYRIAPPFRAEHIGSLKRPADLLAKRKAFDAGKCTQAELDEVADKAIRDVVALQQAVGIKGITDGEFRRHMFWDGFFENLEGMTLVQNPGRELFKMYVPDIKAFFESHAEKPGDTWICTGKIKRRGPSHYARDFKYTASLVASEEVKNIKMTLAAPEWYHLRHGEHAVDKSVYPTDDLYFEDIAKAYREELADLYEAGCRNVQFDDPLLAYFCSQAMLDGMKAEQVDPAPILDQYLQTYNNCIRDVPQDMVVGIHLCRGNFKNGMHFSEGGYDAIAVKLFKELNVSTYYLEYDTDRAGGFEPLAHLPANKTAVIGLVTSKFPKMEEQSYLESRMKEAAKFVAQGSGESEEQALQRLCISPQCGFASHSEGNDMTDDDVKAKLGICVKTAAALWPQDT